MAGPGARYRGGDGGAVANPLPPPRARRGAVMSRRGREGGLGFPRGMGAERPGVESAEVARKTTEEADWTGRDGTAGQGQGFFIRPFGPNRRRPVPANRSGLTGYR